MSTRSVRNWVCAMNDTSLFCAAASSWIKMWKIDWLKTNINRVPKPPGKSWIFFLENSRTWKVLENQFGLGKSWKLKPKVLDSPGKIFLQITHFYRLKWKSFFLLALLCLQITCSPLLLSLWCQYAISKHLWLWKRSWKIFSSGYWKVLEKSWILFVSKRVGTLH